MDGEPLDLPSNFQVWLGIQSSHIGVNSSSKYQLEPVLLKPIIGLLTNLSQGDTPFNFVLHLTDLACVASRVAGD